LKKIAFTSITTNYLPKARVLGHSVKRHAPDVEFVVVLAEPCEAALLRPDDPFDRVITVDKLGIPDLRRWLFTHSVVEACTAIKGRALVKLLSSGGDTPPGDISVVYFDPDIVVTSPLDGLFAELEQSSVLLTPHGIEPETEQRAIVDNEISHLRYGVYNLGFLAVRNTKSGMDFARWWTARLQDYCFDDIEAGIFTDQRWVDLAPSFFDGVKILRDPGYNVATWNLSHRVVKGSLEKGLRVNGRPLIFYHFSGFDSGAMETMLAAYGRKSPVLRRFREWYVRECEARGQSQIGSRPWLYSRFDNGEPITKAQRRLYRDRADLQAAFKDPFAARKPEESYLHWFLRHGATSGRLAADDDYEIIVMALNKQSDVAKRLRKLLARTANKSHLKIIAPAKLSNELASQFAEVPWIEAPPGMETGANREAWMVKQIAECKAPGLVFVQVGLEVPELWDLRLQAGAKREREIVTASPLYDGVDFTALLPKDNTLDETAPEDVDRIVANLDNRLPLESPHFLYECFYVDTALAQSVLDKADSEAAKEAVPFSRTQNSGQTPADLPVGSGLAALGRKCRLAGYHHVILNDLYVGIDPQFGHRSVSARPRCANEASFIRLNVLSEVRARYEEALNQPELDFPTVAQRAARRHLHISHAWGGGLGHWIRSYCTVDSEHVNMLLKPVGQIGAFGSELELFADIDAASPLARWQLPMPIKSTVVAGLAYQRIIKSIVEDYGIDVVFVSSLIGHSLDVLRTSVPTVYICHDYFPLTPEVYIRSWQMSGNRIANFSIDEVFDRGPIALFPNLTRAEAKATSRAFQDILAQRRIRLVAPSPSTRQIYLDLAPSLHPADIEVIVHGTPASLLAEARPAYTRGGKLRVVVPGRVAPEKGRDLLAKVLRQLGGTADVLLLGSGLEGQHLADGGGVQLIERYSPDELPDIMRSFQPHVGLLLSDYPETFSYTLDELMVLGIPPVAVRLGSFADRIRDQENGFLVDNNPQSVIETLRLLDGDRKRLARARAALEGAHQRSEGDMVRDYERLLDLPRFSPRAINSPATLPPSAFTYVAPSIEPPSAGLGKKEKVSARGPKPVPADAEPITSRPRAPAFRNGAVPRQRRRLEQQQYLRLIAKIRQIVDAHVPPKAVVAVVSKGDDQLLRFRRQRGCHFPQTRGGVYAGHHPANSAEAIAHLEELISRGVEYLLVPSTSFWWFEHYREFKQHLDGHYKEAVNEPECCRVYALAKSTKSPHSRKVSRAAK
jgi:glycosyltransferase involved in cell wall biosynthesis